MNIIILFCATFILGMVVVRIYGVLSFYLIEINHNFQTKIAATSLAFDKFLTKKAFKEKERGDV